MSASSELKAENSVSPPDDYCTRCKRSGFELFFIEYKPGYGDGSVLANSVCRDCRAQMKNLVEENIKTTRPHPAPSENGTDGEGKGPCPECAGASAFLDLSVKCEECDGLGYVQIGGHAEDAIDEPCPKCTGRVRPSECVCAETGSRNCPVHSPSAQEMHEKLSQEIVFSPHKLGQALADQIDGNICPICDLNGIGHQHAPNCKVIHQARPSEVGELTEVEINSICDYWASYTIDPADQEKCQAIRRLALHSLRSTPKEKL